MNENPETPRPTEHPEFSAADFYFKEHLPLLKRLAELEDNVGFLRLQFEDEAENTALLEMIVEELEEEQEMSTLLHQEHNARLRRLEERSSGGKLRGWGSSSHKPGGLPDGQAL